MTTPITDPFDIRALTVAAAAKLLKVPPKTIRAHIRRGLPLVDKRIDLIVYGAWLNQQEQKRQHDGA